MSLLTNIQPQNLAPIKELVVISGKGGTGKTSLMASLAVLAKNVVVADCDVDAANLHLLAAPRVLRAEPFSGGKRAEIDANKCITCGQCATFCRFGAILNNSSGINTRFEGYRVDPVACEGCGVCAWFCPVQAIDLLPAVNGQWFVSESRIGPMVHARLGVLEENSGKLVSQVRTAARQLAAEKRIGLVIVDGAPGIGCPVIASITGASLALVVTEPTPSGLHDMQRVAELTRHFGVPTALCINKWDLNEALCEVIEAKAVKLGMTLAGRVRYDRAVVEAQVRGEVILEYSHDGIASDINRLWAALRDVLGEES